MSPTQTPTVVKATPDSDEYVGPETAPFEGVIGLEGMLTGDGRLINESSLSWATFPLPLRWAASDFGGHDGAVIVGRMDSVERRDNGDIYAHGVLDLGSKEGREVARLMSGQFLSGVSMDLDSVETFEAEVQLFNDDGTEIPKVEGAPPVLVTTDARVRAATLVAIPAFDEARLSLIASMGAKDWTAVGHGAFSLTFASAADERKAFRAGGAAIVRRRKELAARLEAFSPKRRALEAMTAKVDTFRYNPLQWRNPRNGKWIDMPGAALIKFFTSLDLGGKDNKGSSGSKSKSGGKAAPGANKGVSRKSKAKKEASDVIGAGVDGPTRNALMAKSRQMDEAIRANNLPEAQNQAAALRTILEAPDSPLKGLETPEADNLNLVLQAVLDARAFRAADDASIDVGDLEGSSFDDPDLDAPDPDIAVSDRVNQAMVDLGGVAERAEDSTAAGWLGGADRALENGDQARLEAEVAVGSPIEGVLPEDVEIEAAAREVLRNPDVEGVEGASSSVYQPGKSAVSDLQVGDTFTPPGAKGPVEVTELLGGFNEGKIDGDGVSSGKGADLSKMRVKDLETGKVTKLAMRADAEVELGRLDIETAAAQSLGGPTTDDLVNEAEEARRDNPGISNGDLREGLKAKYPEATDDELDAAIDGGARAVSPSAAATSGSGDDVDGLDSLVDAKLFNPDMGAGIDYEVNAGPNGPVITSTDPDAGPINYDDIYEPDAEQLAETVGIDARDLQGMQDGEVFEFEGESFQIAVKHGGKVYIGQENEGILEDRLLQNIEAGLDPRFNADGSIKGTPDTWEVPDGVDPDDFGNAMDWLKENGSPSTSNADLFDELLDEDLSGVAIDAAIDMWREGNPTDGGLEDPNSGPNFDPNSEIGGYLREDVEGVLVQVMQESGLDVSTSAVEDAMDRIKIGVDADGLDAMVAVRSLVDYDAGGFDGPEGDDARPANIPTDADEIIQGGKSTGRWVSQDETGGTQDVFDADGKVIGQVFDDGDGWKSMEPNGSVRDGTFDGWNEAAMDLPEAGPDARSARSGNGDERPRGVPFTAEEIIQSGGGTGVWVDEADNGNMIVYGPDGAKSGKVFEGNDGWRSQNSRGESNGESYEGWDDAALSLGESVPDASAGLEPTGPERAKAATEVYDQAITAGRSPASAMMQSVAMLGASDAERDATLDLFDNARTSGRSAEAAAAQALSFLADNQSSGAGPTVPETGGTLPDGATGTRQVSGSDQELHGDLSDVTGGDLIARKNALEAVNAEPGVGPSDGRVTELNGINAELEARGMNSESAPTEDPDADAIPLKLSGKFPDQDEDGLNLPMDDEGVDAEPGDDLKGFAYEASEWSDEYLAMSSEDDLDIDDQDVAMQAMRVLDQLREDLEAGNVSEYETAIQGMKELGRTESPAFQDIIDGTIESMERSWNETGYGPDGGTTSDDTLRGPVDAPAQDPFLGDMDVQDLVKELEAPGEPVRKAAVQRELDSRAEGDMAQGRAQRDAEGKKMVDDANAVGAQMDAEDAEAPEVSAANLERKLADVTHRSENNIPDEYLPDYKDMTEALQELGDNPTDLTTRNDTMNALEGVLDGRARDFMAPSEIDDLVAIFDELKSSNGQASSTRSNTRLSTPTATFELSPEQSAQIASLVKDRMSDPNFKAGMRRTQAATRKGLEAESFKWSASHADPEELFADGWAVGIDGPTVAEESLVERLATMLKEGIPLPKVGEASNWSLRRPISTGLSARRQAFASALESRRARYSKQSDDCGCDEMSVKKPLEFSTGARAWRSPESGQQVEMPGVSLARLLTVLQADSGGAIKQRSVNRAREYTDRLDAALNEGNWEAVYQIAPDFYDETGDLYENFLEAAGTARFSDASDAYTQMETGVLSATTAADALYFGEDFDEDAPVESTVERASAAATFDLKRKNWVEKTGGLPKYIRKIADHLIARGMTESHAIASAVNTVKRWARGGPAAKGNKGHVKPDTVAKAVGALAEWEAKKAAAHLLAPRGVSAWSAYTSQERSKLKAAGYAMKDGSFPINDEDDLKLAVLSISRAKSRSAAREFITQRAVELDRPDLLPEGWAPASVPDRLDAVASTVISVSNDVRTQEPAELGGVALLEYLSTQMLEDSRPKVAALVASAGAALAAPVAPPKGWFADPKLKGVTPLTVTPEGKVYGHLATWDACHLELGKKCVTAPRSRSGYSLFHLGVVTTEDGSDVFTGRLVAATPHADPVWGLNPTLVHYSDTGKAAADVRVGEDIYGIWIAGALRPDATPAQVRTLKASPLSGDWREDPRSGKLELVAALAVNSPGFPIPRPTALVASTGSVSSMFGVGMVAPKSVVKPGTKGAFSTKDLAYLKERAAAVKTWALDAQQLSTLRRSQAERTLASFARQRMLESFASTIKEIR